MHAPFAYFLWYFLGFDTPVCTARQVDRVRVDFGPKRLDHFSTAALTSSKFLVVFADPTAKDVGTVVIGRVDSDDALHFSQEHRFLLGTGVTGVAVSDFFV